MGLSELERTDRVPAIDVRGLTRRFNDFVAVDGATIAIRQGEMFGLIGPNGAGHRPGRSKCLGSVILGFGSRHRNPAGAVPS